MDAPRCAVWSAVTLCGVLLATWAVGALPILALHNAAAHPVARPAILAPRLPFATATASGSRLAALGLRAAHQPTQDAAAAQGWSSAQHLSHSPAVALGVALCTFLAAATALMTQRWRSTLSITLGRSATVAMAAITGEPIAIGADIPRGILVDMVDPATGDIHKDQDLGALLSRHSCAVLFAVPGAFTPICSEQHLPGFIATASALRARGAEAVYCLAVNDRFVLKAWGKATEGMATSGIQLVADGNGAFAAAMGLVKDATEARMGPVRAKRFACVIRNGRVAALRVDEKGIGESTAENILALL